jgi:acyl transferase domain-containing protein/acyl carrier protein
MGHKLLGVDKSELFSDNSQSMEVEDISGKEIAVIGMAGRFADAADIGEFWEALRAGRDFIGEFPVSRRLDSDRLVDFWGNAEPAGMASRYSEGAYFKEIDQFDHQLFNISPAESNLMDPNQRIFIETVWAALEDAGYGGNRLSGTKTGVFVGHSCDFGYDYRHLIQFIAPSQMGFSVPGNIQSIIASRIAYLLDFKGPSMLVNTACSSSLTAIHLACRSIRNGECELAVAGGVKVILAPLKANGNEAGIRVLSLDGRARTFDDSSDGTGMGEGAGAVLLKPLKLALLDGDQIYAVIKGSAMNQDGNSIGITAPNSAAQEEVILQAWKDADIEPETISYIEAHGTGTKLGDPIEISGIQKAFRHYTGKKQFCAVTAVKTNVGHLDHAAGIVAFIKAVLALQNKQIPPTLNFVTPNRKINFTESPVYVNDRLIDWETRGFPRRCGVSAFGLSGTNCHLVLEEAPAPLEIETRPEEEKAQILALSAKNADSLRELVQRYRKIVINGCGARLPDLCYTANTGRGHYEYRLAIVFANEAELREKITGVADPTLSANPEQGVFYRNFKLVVAPKVKLMDGEISADQKQALNREAGQLLKQLATAADEEKVALLSRIAAIYVRGAEIPWEELYRGQKYQKISLPVYPFRRKRHWCEPELTAPGANPNPARPPQGLHPLLDSCLAESVGIDIYLTRFSTRRHWVLNEHKVAGNYILPGTVYLEMAREIGRRYYPGMALELKDVFFITPLAVREDEIKEVQTVIRLESDHYGFAVASRAADGMSWVTHAEGKIFGFKPPARPATDAIEFAETLKKFETESSQRVGTGAFDSAIETGPRWESLQNIRFHDQSALAYFELKPEFGPDLLDYKLHPAMMDCAVNVGIREGGGGLYLPFSYRSLKILKPISGKVYSYLRKNTKTTGNQETVSFDITLREPSGAVIAEAENYIIKKVPEDAITALPAAGRELYFDIGWITKPLNMEKQRLQSGSTMIFHDEKGVSAAIGRELKNSGIELIEVTMGREYRQATANEFTIGVVADDYRKLCDAVRERGVSRIIHLSSLTREQCYHDADSFEAQQKRGLESLFHLTKGLIQHKMRGPISLILIADYAFEVSKNEIRINPLHAAFFGLGKVIGQEHEHIKCRSIDIDDQTNSAVLLEEIIAGDEYRVAYRNGNRYIEEFQLLDLSRSQSRMTEINDRGVYVITGGTGGLGLEIGKYLASRHKVNLCLLNRSPFPERDTWPEILRKNEDRKVCRKIEAILALEANGSKVDIYQADVSSIDALQEIFGVLRSKYGRIQGIVHCAGVAGDGFIFRKEPHLFEQVINPKIKGTWVLDQLTQNDSPDFFILFSSVNAFLGGPGQGDYTAANAFLDSFAVYRNQKGRRTLAINWPAWKETGMAVDYGVHNMAGIFKALPTMTALKAFDKVLSLGLARVIVGELDENISLTHQAELQLAVSPGLTAMLQKRAKTTAAAPRTDQRNSGAGIVMKGKELSEFNEIERHVAQIWSTVLGLEEVNIHDNFAQLGGDSILATRLLKEMEKEYPGLVDITDIFTYQTVFEMAAYLDRKLRPESKPKANINRAEDLHRLLSSLANGEITADEADRLINLRGDQE